MLDFDEVAARLVLALQHNSTSWTALNMAGLYWRVVGNAPEVCARSGHP